MYNANRRFAELLRTDTSSNCLPLGCLDSLTPNGAQTARRPRMPEFAVRVAASLTHRARETSSAAELRWQVVLLGKIELQPCHSTVTLDSDGKCPIRRDLQ